MLMQREPPIRWLKIREVGEYLSISKTSVWRLMKRMEADEDYKNSIIRYQRMVRVREDKLTEFVQRGLQ